MTFSNWLRFAGWLALETTAIAATAAIIGACLRSPCARRTLWQAAFTAMALVLAVQCSGFHFAPTLPAPQMNSRHRLVVTTSTLPIIEPSTERSEPAVAPEVSPQAQPVKWPGWIWLGGTALLLTRTLAGRIALGFRRRAALPADAESIHLIDIIRRPLGLAAIRCEIWRNLSAPVAFSILRPTIALPSHFSTRFSTTEKQAMLAHELAHLAARDPLWALASDLIASLLWWQPAVWWTQRKLDIATEESADEASALVPDGPSALAECLLRLGRELASASGTRLLGVAGDGSKSRLARRIEQLLQQTKAWQPSRAVTHWIAQSSAVALAAVSATLPIQTDASGSILALLMTPASAIAKQTTGVIPQAAPTTNTFQPPQEALPIIHLEPPPPGPTTFSEIDGYSDDHRYHIRLYEPQQAASSVISSNTTTQSEGPGTSMPQPQLMTTPPGKSAEHLAHATTNDCAVAQIFTITATNSCSNPVPAVVLQFKLVEIRQDDSDGLGLNWIFGKSRSNNPALEVSHDWQLLAKQTMDTKGRSVRLTNFGIRTLLDTNLNNVTIDRLHTEGESAVLSSNQFAALLGEMNSKTGADVLAAPKVTTLSGRQAHVAMQDVTNIVTGVTSGGIAGSNFGVGYQTCGFGLGPQVDVIPNWEENGDWKLLVLGNVFSFVKYEAVTNPSLQVLYPDGKTVAGEPVWPHFREIGWLADAHVPNGQTLAIRGPEWSETEKIKGGFFTRSKIKTTHQRLYIFVTAQQIDERGNAANQKTN